MTVTITSGNALIPSASGAVHGPHEDGRRRLVLEVHRLADIRMPDENDLGETVLGQIAGRGYGMATHCLHM